jgi:hypothetical protein
MKKIQIIKTQYLLLPFIDKDFICSKCRIRNCKTAAKIEEASDPENVISLNQFIEQRKIAASIKARETLLNMIIERAERLVW